MFQIWTIPEVAEIVGQRYTDKCKLCQVLRDKRQVKSESKVLDFEPEYPNFTVYNMADPEIQTEFIIIQRVAIQVGRPVA
jgi:hypothetical protein